MILIGKGLEYLPYFVYTFERMGEVGLGTKREKFQLELISVETATGEKKIYDGAEKRLSRGFAVRSLSDFARDGGSADRITLKFVTPVRIKRDGRLTSSEW
ncbi:MAG: hypothetical protein ACE5LH_00705 [Fidelibacterota bacterium]